MSDLAYQRVIAYYEACLAQHGHGPKAVNWKSEGDARVRYDIMLGMIGDKTAPASLLDFGCGLAGLKSHMDQLGLAKLRYTGLEISKKFATQARRLHRNVDIICCDVLRPCVTLTNFDYIIMNGIFTRRHDLSNAEMQAYMQSLLITLFKYCNIGLAFNVMSRAVDWENEALFHPDPGLLLSFVGQQLTPHFALRNEYGLHESALYLYRRPFGQPSTTDGSA